MTTCAVCSRRLTHPVSVARGTGPVCAKHVAEFIAAISAQTAERIRQSWARRRDEMVGVNEMAIANAKARFLARIRRQPTVPTYSGMIADQFSRTRQQEEVLEFYQFADAAVQVHSESGREYVLTTDRTGTVAVACSCPDCQHRHRVCRHMEGYNRFAAERRMAEQSEAERQRVAEAMRTETGADVPLETTNRITGAPTILTHIVDGEVAWDNERDRALYAWHELHRHDGVYMSQDDVRWQALRESATTLEGLGEYETEHVLDGSGLAFGLELEVDDVSGDRVAHELHALGLSAHRYVQSYSTRVGEGDGWTVKRDGSVPYGCEIVSPPLTDTPETWAAIHEITRIVKQHGGRASRHTGLHIHMGNTILDDRGYRWQRLARYIYWFGPEYYQMGAANEREGVTTHRGLGYAAPLQVAHIRKLRRNDNAMEASRKLIGYRGHDSRYKIINTAKFVESNIPTVEFRYPNGSVDPIMIQRQVQLANATMMQAAYLRRHMPGAERLPALFRGDQSDTLAQDSEGRFRQFLDTLGSERLRRIATSLWVRGEIPASYRQ
ncbi:amidoligase family protein [Alicyclobacillus acidocaldarius]|uniref:amidoligase family protein n=1 Tax=Alicyclobacillus acidocaldarius TaxID=405212 RepID=UPI0003118535|nr:amidoligase family protein [Alicyclobacillus acidocaldarius]